MYMYACFHLSINQSTYLSLYIQSWSIEVEAEGDALEVGGVERSLYMSNLTYIYMYMCACFHLSINQSTYLSLYIQSWSREVEAEGDALEVGGVERSLNMSNSTYIFMYLCIQVSTYRSINLHLSLSLNILSFYREVARQKTMRLW